jgi:large subunit ribosomal protein L31
MKKKIHPTYHKVDFQCSCGNKFTSFSTFKKDKLSLDVCYKCHPFYTGKQKILDIAGRVDRFKQMYNKKKK